PVVSASGATPTAQQLIDDARAAEGGAEAWQRLGTLALVGTMKAAGLEGSYSATEDPRTGRWVTSYALGLLQGGEGYDGTTAWSRTPGGELTVLDASPAREAAVTRAWLVKRSYLLPPAEPTTPAAPRPVSEDGRRLLVIDAIPSGGLPIELWFDAATGLLDRTVERQGAETVTTRYGDYREVGGVAIAFMRRESRGDPRTDVEIRLQEVSVLPEIDAEIFALPAPAPADFRFAGPIAASTVPFELLANHVYVEARLDGRPLRFLLDTGGVNLLTTDAAARLGLESRGEMHRQGAGEGSVSVGLAKVASLALGDVELVDQTFYVVPLGHVAGEHGASFDGLLGFEVFSRFVVTLDYAGRQLTLTEPGRFDYRGTGARIPLRFADRIPVIEAAIDGIGGAFSIDTGARNSLTLTSPFVAQHDFVQRYEASRERVVGWGVGGPVVAHVARARELAIGPLHVEWPVTELYTGERGAFASTELAGNIGGGILRRFTAIF
ncbi:MAG TPA: retropepsin-like aspartic protease, partial [Gammaproteobacteria bacterium]|nr:retropepsin-like aspartic protease [Gammaproteobacteria bacterium]